MGTETATFVFTDLVGSTALMSAVGEVVAEELRREHFALLRGALAGTGGREVKNLGDGIMAVFSSASDAVQAAVEIQRAADRRNRRSEHPLVIRVGISLGDADVDDGDYFGPPVVQAARLCARAEGGEILAAELVRLLAGGRSGFEFEPVGELELKGLDEPVPASRVRWASDDGSGGPIPLPARLASADVANFAGRTQEWDELHSAWKRSVADARRHIVLLSGEPGIGKSTLAARLASAAHADGAAVAYGRCDEDLGIAFQPWIEALTHLATSVPERVLRAHVAERGAHLARLVPDLRERVPAAAPETGSGDDDRYVIFGCVIDLLERISTERPVVLVLDDLHWADRATLQLLRHVAAAERPMRLMILGTFRDSDVTSRDPLADVLAALHRERDVVRIGLRGLTDVELLEWLEATAGHEMDLDGLALRDALLAETAGNPFFAGEVLRHLAATGAIAQDESGRWVGRMDLDQVGLPVSVKEVVGRRLGGLGPDAERILAMAAVVGRDFDLGVLARATGSDEEAVLDVCDAAVAASVLQTTEHPDRYTFAHALIEHTLYDGLSPARRARAHRAVAEAIEATSDLGNIERAGELAHHWAAAVAPTDASKALHYAELAARASAELAPDDALRWYEQALGLADRSAGDDPRRRVELLVGLGDAQRRVGDPAHRETLLDAAHRAAAIDAVDLQVRAVLANSRGFYSDIGGADAERIAAVEAALARLDGTDVVMSAERARLLALLAVEQYFVTPLEHRMQLAQEAIDIARRLDDPAVLAQVLYQSDVAVRAPDTLQLRARWMAEVVSLADASPEAGSRIDRFDIFANAAIVATEAADPADLAQLRARCADVVRRVPHATWRWEHAYNTYLPVVMAGDLDAAESQAETALNLGTESMQADAFTIYAGQLINVRLHQGRLHELNPLMEEVLAETPRLTSVRGALTLGYARAGEIDRARGLLDQAIAPGTDHRKDFQFTTTVACLAETAALCGSAEAARSVRPMLEPYHSHLVTTTVSVQPPIAHYLGRVDTLLGRHDDAERWFAEAMGVAERFESPLLVAYTQAAWALLCAERNGPGDVDRARSLATGAHDAAERLGMGYVEADARAVLDRL